MSEADTHGISPRRMEEAESRLAFLDDTVDKLGEIIARQDRELAELRLQVSAMARKLRELGEAAVAEGGEMGHEPPPHY
ncbi:SlyX family protein [Elongatibacter sediminis]|uniref:SlyX family protein n=1 Tax=Elongatibacter sediminis TaxID=3119006 RepID=A0AAW9RKR0_9GAMM